MKNFYLRLFLFFCLILQTTVFVAQNSTKLSGNIIGTQYSIDYTTGTKSTTVNTKAEVFDGDFNTFFASYNNSNTWVGLDLGTPHVITKVGWSPRKYSSGPQKVQLGLFEGSNREDFLDAVPLFLNAEASGTGRMHYADVNVSRGFRYVRYVGPAESKCSISELEFYGYEGNGDDCRFYQVTNLPTLSIHVYSGQEPDDKVNDLEANMTLVYDAGTRIQEYPITTRLRGNASQSFPKKPYRIKFNDGKSHHMLKGSPLESPAKAKKWTLINNYGDKTLMRNILAFELSRRAGMPYTPYCQPVDVIMNGEYKGCYQLCDQVTTDPNRVDIIEMEPSDNEQPYITGGYLLEVDAYASGNSSFYTNRGMPITIKEPDENDITSQQKQYITNYFNQLEDAVFSAAYKDSVNGYRKYLDVESFVRHFIVGEFSGNTDTYWSTYMSKNRNSDQFVVAPCWDFDLAFNNDIRIYPVCDRDYWVYLTGGSSAYNMDNFVKRIFTDPYVNKMLKRIWNEKVENGAFTADGLIHFVDSMAAVLNQSQQLNFIRWPILNTRVHQNAFALGSYEAEVDVLRNYIPERIEWISDFLKYSDVEVKDTTIYIASAQQMVEFSKYVNMGASYTKGILTADIDMAGITDYSPAGKEGCLYRGEFDGQGHVISNLHIKGNSYTGVFGMVGDGAYIHDFTLDGTCSIKGSAFVGVVGGSNESGTVIIERVGNEANITGVNQNISGIFGCNMGSKATLFISHCYNSGTITGGYESAGLSGWLGDNATVENCYNIGTVSGADNESKTFVRYSSNCNFLNCYETAGGQVNRISMDKVANGELCYRLNNNGKEELWRQVIGEDKSPVLRYDHSLVLYDQENGSYYNPLLYTVTYMIDGEVLKTEQLANGSNIKLPQPPGKNGYTFSGWEGSPEVMPAENIEVTGHYIMLGDLMKNGKVEINDVVRLVGLLLGQAPRDEDELKAADMNEDGQLVINDVTLLINVLLGVNEGNVNTASEKSRCVDYTANMTLCATNNGFGVNVSNAMEFAAIQFDMLLPKGASVSNVRMKGNRNHNAIFYENGHGKVRVVVMSMSNENFFSEDLLEVMLDAPGDAQIFIDSVCIAAKSGEMYRLPNLSALLSGQSTNINETSVGDTMNDVYDLNGRIIKENATTTTQLRRGIYVVNGKKIVVK